jgi:hypothetical protein
MARGVPGAKGAVFQLKVTLKDARPAIWRRLLVPADIPLDKLHFVLNEAVGWTCSHLHSFTLRDRTFGDPRSDAGTASRPVQ